MKNEALERPVITEFIGDGFKLDKAHEMYLNNLELWNYVQALDEYCDYLESKSCEGNPDSDTSGGLHLAYVNGSALLSSLLNKQREIISSPIRFNGVSNDDIIKVFSEHGIKYEQPF